MAIIRGGSQLGEMRTSPSRPLFVDMVPSICWFSNLRSELEEDEWTAVKEKTSARAGYCCEICESRGPKWPVECHERWGFDMATHVQTLLNVVALCPACHEATHYGLATLKGRNHIAKWHLMRVNDWDNVQAEKHIKEAGDLWTRRSEIDDWRLDARWILNYVSLSEESKSKIVAYANATRERAV